MNNGSMVNVEDDQSTKFASMKGNDKAMLRVINLIEDMSDMEKMIACRQGMQKKIIKLPKSV